MGPVVGARGPDAPLDHETGNDSMKRRVIIPAGFHQLQEVANVFGGKNRVHLERYIAETGVKQNISAELVDGRILEWLELFAFDLDAADLERGDCQSVAVGRRERDAIYNVDSFGDLAEGRELTVELGLR